MQKQNQSIGNITFSDTFVKWSEQMAFEVFEKNIGGFSSYIKTVIVDWTKVPETIEGETEISRHLSIYFNDIDDVDKTKRFIANDMFCFSMSQESKDKGHSKNDLGISINQRKPERKGLPLILRIEAKRLPTLGTNRQKEYISKYQENKEQGGIARHKTGAHGSTHLKAMMIGYVQKEDFDYWISNVNNWISEQAVQSDNPSIYQLG
jgi:hypothetical protein